MHCCSYDYYSLLERCYHSCIIVSYDNHSLLERCYHPCIIISYDYLSRLERCYFPCIIVSYDYHSLLERCYLPCIIVSYDYHSLLERCYHPCILYLTGCSQHLYLLNGSVTIDGELAKFQCDVGFHLLGSPTAECINGSWNRWVPICSSKYVYDSTIRSLNTHVVCNVLCKANGDRSQLGAWLDNVLIAE